MIWSSVWALPQSCIVLLLGCRKCVDEIGLVRINQIRGGEHHLII